MRKTSRSGPFFMVLLFNILINFRLTIPGWILLILHFIIPQYIKWWYCLVYFGVFLLYMLIWMLILWGIGAWASTAEPTPKPKNVNPYSVRNSDMPWNKVNKNPCSVKNESLSYPANPREERSYSDHPTAEPPSLNDDKGE